MSSWIGRRGVVTSALTNWPGATNQSSRGVQRHLKTLVEAGWLFRHAEVRGPGLHHKSFTILNQDKVREVLKRSRDTTELVKPDTTDLVNAYG